MKGEVDVEVVVKIDGRGRTSAVGGGVDEGGMLGGVWISGSGCIRAVGGGVEFGG